MKSTAFVAVLGFAFLAAGPVAARNTRHVLPIQATLDTPQARKAIGSDIPVSFGSALPRGLSILNESMTATGKVDPRIQPLVLRATQPPMDDTEACTGAFIAAVADLANQARRAGATSVVGVVGVNEGSGLDSTDKFECHSGYSRSTVELKGMAAVRGNGDGPTLTRSAAQAPTAAAPAPVAPPAAAAPVARAANQHRSAVPAATGFARGDDVNAVPLNDAGKARYRHYLTLPSPKAFVIFETGAWRFYADDTDAMTKALDYCASERKTCWLYAVDDRVVWNDNVAKRIAKSGQLGNE
ncbi:MAG: hypothetical protein ABW190_09800 [Rhizobacter sp.]